MLSSSHARFRSHGPNAAPRRGFALLVTIILVAFLVLILVGLATFTRVETQVADNSQQLARARQNALFALNVALGQLQRAAGPDQRVTATAEALSTTDPTKRKWTGAWNTTVTNPTPIWLVSSPNGTTPVNTGAAPALVAGVNASTSAVRLLGSASIDPATTGDGVVVPLQELRSNNIPGLADDTSGSGGHLIGRFGYWVGDEGVKARVNLENPFIAPWKSGAADAAEQISASALAQRTAVEWMPTGAGSTLFNSHLDDAARTQLDQWLAPNQLPFYADTAVASNTTDLRAAGRVRYHDLTIWSAGVQTDVRLGGLKRDLTAAFELNDADFRASIFGINAPSTERALLQNGDYSGLVFAAPTSSAVGAPAYKGPTWHLLRNHYRLYREATNLSAVPSFNARNFRPAPTGNTYLDIFNGTGVSPDPKTNDTVTKDGSQTTPRPTQPALLPYLNRISMVFSIQTIDTGTATPDLVPIHSVRVVMTPYVVLHNPYNVRLSLQGSGTPSRWAKLQLRGIPFDQILRASNGVTTVDFTSRNHPVDHDTNAKRAIPLLLAAEAMGAGSYNNFMNLYLPALTLEPGEVRVFSADLSTTTPVGNALDLKPNAYFSSGYYFDRLNVDRAGFFGQTYSRVACPIGVGGALVPATDDFVKVPANWSLSLGLYASNKTGDNNSFIGRFNVRTNPTDNLDANSALYSEIYVKGPGLGAGANDTYDRAYSGYDTFEQFRGGQLASTYTGTPTPLFAYDIYVKPADEVAAQSARPLVTSNPFAVVSQRDAFGDWSARGYALTSSSWQPRYRTLSPNAWTNGEVFAVDAGGNGRAYWGPTNSDTGLQQVAPLSVPVAPMTSLAQFQHLQLSLYGNEPLFAVGNSWSTPYTAPTATLANPRRGAIDWWTADLSYLANQGLWDRSFFSTLAPGFDGTTYYTAGVAAHPQSRESVRDAWLAGTRSLPNSRVHPYRSPNRTEAVRQTQLLDPERAAANLLVAGSFNINSRSIPAWTAILGGARQAAVRRLDGTSVALGDDTGIPRSVPAYNGVRGAPADDWNGFARLTDAQITALATQIVAQIAARHAIDARPFLSLAEFINRRIAAPADATLNAKGPLQAAIDATTLNSAIPGTVVDATAQSRFPYPQQGQGSAASAASGFLSQADLLQQIGPFLSARSDTFTIRTYGENLSPVTGESQGRAWCEAIVQRLPDYVNSIDAPEKSPAEATLAADNQTFGRRFQIVSFRWLNAEDL